jgi:hypothetical protein
MTPADYFLDCGSDLCDAIEQFQDELCFDGDSPSVNKMKLIRAAWDKLKARYETWLEALAELEGPR